MATNGAGNVSCPFLWHIVPLPSRFNEECVVAASTDRDDALGLRTTPWLEQLIIAKVRASSCLTADRRKATLRLLPFTFYACRKALGTVPDRPGAPPGLARRVRELREWMQQHEPRFFDEPQRYVVIIDSSLWEAFFPRVGGRSALEFIGGWPEAPRLQMLARETIAWGEKKEKQAFGHWSGLLAVPYASLPLVRGRLSRGRAFRRGRAPRLVSRRGRDTLVAAAFSVDAYPFRQTLLADCREHSTTLCREHQIAISDHKRLSAAAGVSQLYRRSDFCLQPPGDTVTRKGIFDAWGLGCIPVVFSELALSQYAPHLLPNASHLAIVAPTPADPRPASFPGLGQPVYTRQYVRLLQAIRDGGGADMMRERLHRHYWSMQYDGEPWAAVPPSVRCDALCRAAAALAERVGTGGRHLIAL